MSAFAPILDCKVVPVISPVDTNGATAALNTGHALVVENGVDTSNAGYALFIFQFGNVAAAVAALKLTENDVATSGTDADIVGTVGTVGGDPFALPGTSSDNTIVAIGVQLGGARKRYIAPLVTGGAAATLVSCTCILCNPGEVPSTAAEMGVATLVKV